MALFLHQDVFKLLYNKYVVIIGDSVHRGIYKDLIALLQADNFMSKNDLKAKGEMRFMGDTLVEGGVKGEMNNGINYREVREYKTDTHLIRFYFVTRVHNKYWREVILEDLGDDPQPDVIIMNSCLWDLSRYGSSGMVQYKENLEKTFQLVKKIVSPDCLVIWDTALPVAKDIKGGFLLPELGDLTEILRLDVLEGNYYAGKLALRYGVDVIDLNFHFRSFMNYQVKDGVHWDFRAHRRFTNMILARIAKAWGLGLPREGDVRKISKKPSPEVTVKPIPTVRSNSPLLKEVPLFNPYTYPAPSYPKLPDLQTCGTLYHQSNQVPYAYGNPYKLSRTKFRGQYNPYAIPQMPQYPNLTPMGMHIMNQRRQRLLAQRSFEVAGAMFGGMADDFYGQQMRYF